MEEKKYIPIKFETSTEIRPLSYEVTLSFDDPLISPSKFDDNKKNIWYGIEREIDREGNGFNATEHLHAMIELKKYKKGSTFYIKKLKGDKFTYFAISDNGNEWKTMNDLSPVQNVTTNIETKTINRPPEPNDATKLNTLWNDYQARTQGSGHKPGDEDMPF